MAGIRPASSVAHSGKVAWTRYSKKNPKRSYIKAMPHKNLVVFRMGEMKDEYNASVSLVSQVKIILRDNAIESARQSANKYLEKELTPANYYFVVRIYPHHVIRENKMIAGAGADRLQKGMRMSFGRATGRGARINRGTAIFTVYSYKANVGKIEAAFGRAKRKLTGKYKIEVV